MNRWPAGEVAPAALLQNGALIPWPRATATKTGRAAGVGDSHGRLENMQMQLDRTRETHAADREKLADRTRLADNRFADTKKRALLDVERERTALTEL